MRVSRVVHISLGTHVGGMEKLLVEFAKFTNRSRYDLTCVSLQRAGDLASEIQSHHCPVIAMNKAEGLKPALVARLAATLRRINPDVVHTHNTAGYVYGVTAAVIARVPRIIHTRHGQRFDSSRRQTMLFRGLSRWVDHVVSVSDDGCRLSIDEGIAPAKASTICNGVDLSRFKFNPDRASGSIKNPAGNRALVVARLSPEKDIATLIRAMKIIRCSGSDSRLDIVGDGAERTSLEALSLTLGLHNAVHFHGMTDDVPSALASASLFVLPSVTEGISLTLLEAMAVGLPVVACDTGGNPEVVADGKTGFLVPTGNPQAMADAMLRFYDDKALAQRFGSAGRKRVEQKFCIRAMVRAYESLYAGTSCLAEAA